ncbi:PAS domain S-box protein [Aquamicrobium sp. LC103]|uniref:sensor histidine kinase n=1 Tax=Aquamicrobium sp. LC103 TaxID=1120658 RepID=UPI000699EEB9|nr:PAS domain S-box protein [Aquamicrobium sp. LC103]
MSLSDYPAIALPTSEQLLQSIPAAVYLTDAHGRITFYNNAAAKLWGVHPEIGKSEFCGSWKLYWPDGTELPHDQCPMAQALKERRPIVGKEAVAERPDGTRVPFLPFPTPLFDSAGQLTGAINMLVDLSELKDAETSSLRLAAIVESSDDAILAKDLNGIITDWNRGAEKIFGYTREEAVGQSVTMLIPEDRQDEEPDILSRIRRGERVDHYETVRRRKDGTLIDISLAVSPIINRHGRVIGASKIARDVTERRRAENQKNLILREMNHRVKNLFTLAGSLVALSARTANSAEQLATSVRERFTALAQAHSLTLPVVGDSGGGMPVATSLHALIDAISRPYTQSSDASLPRVVVTGEDIVVSGPAVTHLALLLHEFATNAAKYGALANSDACVAVSCAQADEDVHIIWKEDGAFPSNYTPDNEGFGTLLTKAAISGALGGEFRREFTSEGLTITIRIPKDRLIE